VRGLAVEMPSPPVSSVCRLLRRLLVGVLGTPSSMFRCGSRGSAVVSDTAFLPHQFEPSHRQNPSRVSFIGSRSDGSADAMRRRNRSSLLGTLQHVRDMYVYSSSQRRRKEEEEEEEIINHNKAIYTIG